MNQTIELLREMNLRGVIRGLEEQKSSSLYSDLSFDERLAHLVDHEHNFRYNKAIERNLSEAKLKQRASIEEIDFQVSRGIRKSQMLELSQCRWVEDKNNIIITGATGVGKTYIACACVNSACRKRYKAKYEKTSNMLSLFAMSRIDGSFPRLFKALSKVKILLLDEWLRDRLNATQSREILDLLDERYLKVPTIFASQLPVDKWHAHIEDPTIADAILDRILHNAQRIELKGDSMRKILGDRGGNTSLNIDQCSVDIPR